MKEKLNIPSVSYTLDRRYKTADDTYVVCLHLVHKNKRKYYPIRNEEDASKIRMTAVDFKSLAGSRGSKRKILDRCDAVKTEALEIIKEMNVFSFEKFEAGFFSDKGLDRKNIISLLKSKAKDLRANGRLKTALGYESTASSIENFTGFKVFNFHQITVEWLNEYEKHMLKGYTTKKGKHKTRSLTTVGIYLRNLRHIVKPHLTGPDYPFGSETGKYEIPTGRNVKRALPLKDVAKIYNYKSKSREVQRFRDYWILSYLCNGANIKDLARLKYSDIDVSYENISFMRSKTSGKNRGRQRKIVVPITKEIASILDRWKVPGTTNDFILPILTHGLNETQELNRIESTVKAINKTMREIAATAGIKIDVTTYTARHSFATILMQSGAKVEFICKALGYSNVNTTESYLGDFDTETKRSYAKELTAFTKE